jgi:hypothetical protein
MEDHMVTTDTEILNEITRFNDQLVHLNDSFVSWIQEGGHKVDVLKEDIVKNEELSGQYNTFKYLITLDNKLKLQLIPYGIWIVAAKGRVDVYGPSGYEKLVYLYKGDPVSTIEMKTENHYEKTTHKYFDNIDDEGWYWYDDSTIRKMTKLSKEVADYLVSRVQ